MVDREWLKDRVLGVVFGTAIGDALGYPVEFDKSRLPVVGLVRKRMIYKDLEWVSPFIGTDLPDAFERVREMNVAPYSDDTQMFRATLDGLLDFETRLRPEIGLDPDELAGCVSREYVKWAFGPDNNRSPGAACMHGCRNLREGIPWREAGKKDARGCGAAMRSMAYGLVYCGDSLVSGMLAAEHAPMTHQSPEGQASAAIVAAVTSQLAAGAPRTAVLKYACRWASRLDPGVTMHLVDTVEAMVTHGHDHRVVLDRLRGWTGAEAVAASLFCFLRAKNYQDAVLTAVNSPGDSDSLGAITGAFAGAFWGRRSIPEDWVATIEDRAGLESYGDRIVDLIMKKGLPGWCL